MYPKNTERKLTGRMRMRHGFFGRMVPEVEVAVLRYSACPPMPGRHPGAWREQLRGEGETHLEWRDATWEDLQMVRLTVGAPA